MRAMTRSLCYPAMPELAGLPPERPVLKWDAYGARRVMLMMAENFRQVS